MNVRAQQKAWTGRQVLLALLAFFAVFGSVNALFVYKALQTNPGLIVPRSYQQGLTYNETLAAAEAQTASGITGDIDFSQGVLSLRLRDRAGRPLTGGAGGKPQPAQVTAWLMRPVQQGQDFSVSLDYAGAGLYQVPITFPLPGRWRARLEAVWPHTPTQQPFRSEREILVP